MRIPYRSLAVLALAGSAATCVDVATGPKPMSARRGRILIAPQFSASAARTAQNLADFGIQYDSARVVIVRPVADTLIDTTLAFRPGQQDITLDLTVPVHSDGEVFDAGMQFRDAARVLFQGVTRVASHASSESAPNTTPLQVEYVGPGSSVVRLQISPAGGTAPTGGSTAFGVIGFDAGGAVVPLVPVVWTVSDPSLADVTQTGQNALVRSIGKRGTVTVTARTPRDVADHVSLTFTPVAGSIQLVSGGGQTSAVGAPLGSPITIEVRATDNIGLPSVAVSFTPPAGGSVTPASATTDASGRASTSVTLGNTAGPQTITATAAGFSLAVTATALPAGPASLAMVSGDAQTDTVRKALRAPLVVKALDKFSNPVAGATVTWAKSGGGSLSAATSTSGADGQASVSYTLGPVVGDETITASVTGAATPVTFSVHAVRSAPAGISVVSGNAQTGSVNATLAAQLVVKVVDAGNFPVSAAQVSWAATNATVVPSSTTDAEGLARVSLKLGAVVGPASATAGIGTAAVAFTATAVPGAVSSSVFKRQPSNAVANVPIAPAVEVQLFDAFGNATTSAASVALTLSGGAEGAVLTGTATRNAVSGVATFDDLKINKLGTGYRLVATVGETQATSDAFGVAAAAAANLAIVSGNNQSALAGGSVETRPSVRVTDGSGNPVSGATVTFAPATGSGSVTGGTPTTDANGVATVGSWTVGTAVGTSTLLASVAGAGSVSFTATVTPAAPSSAVFKRQPSNAVANTAIAPPVEVQLFDAFGNATTSAASIAITLTGGTAGAVLSGTATRNALNGIATFDDLKVDKSGSGYRLIATVAVTGNPQATSDAFGVTAAAAANLAIVSGNNQSALAGGSVESRPSVRVTDLSNNPVTGATVTFAPATGSGSVTGGSQTTDANGVATVGSWTVGTVVGTSTLVASVSGAAGVNFTANVTPAGPASVVFTTQPSNVVSMLSIGTFTVSILDQFGNVVTTAAPTTITVAITTGTGAAGAAITGTTASSVAGVAAFSNVKIDKVGVAYRLTASGAGLTSAQSLTFNVTTGAAASMVPVAGTNNLAAQVGTAVSAAPAVFVTDLGGNPVAGVGVTFVAGANSGTVVPSTPVSTGTNGIASATSWTLGTTLGANSATASASGLTPFTFSATATTGGVAAVSTTSGGGSEPPTSVSNNTTFGSGPKIQLVDGQGNPVSLAGITVTTEVAPGITLTPNFAVTNASGVADFSPALVRGVVGTYAVQFRVMIGDQSYTTVSRNFDVRAGTPTSLIAAEALPSFVLHGTVLTPRVIARDIDNNLVSGASVIFAVTGGTGTLASPPTRTTDANGIATGPSWTLPTVDLLNNQVTACVAGIPVTNCSAVPPVAFTVETTHPKRLVVVQQHATGATFANGAALGQITVQLRDDTRDIPLNGVLVTAEPIGGDPGSFTLPGNPTAVTGSTGLATFPGIVIDAVAQANLSVRFNTTYTMSGLAVTSGSTNNFTAVPGTATFLDAVVPGVFDASTSTLFSPAPAAKVTDANHRNTVSTPVTSVQWTLLSCPSGTSTTTPVVTTSGVSASSITAGGTTGSCSVHASASGLTGSPVTFTLVIHPPGFVTFTGRVGTSWNDPNNWSNSLVPTGNTDVYIASAVANKPILTAGGATRALTLESGTAQVNIGANILSAVGNVDASGQGITGAGNFTVTPLASVTVRGTLPKLTLGSGQGCGANTIGLNGAMTVNGFLAVNCRLIVGNNALTVNNAMTVNSTGAFDMTTGAVVLVTGDAAFNGQTSNLTGGTLELKGNLSEGSAVNTAFAGSGSFLVRFTADALQTVSFVPGHVDPQGSRFQRVEILNGGISSLVRFSTDAKVLGSLDLLTGARMNITGINRLFIHDGGTIRLHAGSTLTLDGFVDLEAQATCQRHNGSPPATINGANPGNIVGGSCTLANLP